MTRFTEYDKIIQNTVKSKIQNSLLLHPGKPLKKLDQFVDWLFLVLIIVDTFIFTSINDLNILYNHSSIFTIIL